MKKKLEGELISIAHRVLQLKNKSEVIALQQEAKNLYEKLTVLRFAEEYFTEEQPTFGLNEVEEKVNELISDETLKVLHNEVDLSEDSSLIKEEVLISQEEITHETLIVEKPILDTNNESIIKEEASLEISKEDDLLNSILSFNSDESESQDNLNVQIDSSIDETESDDSIEIIENTDNDLEENKIPVQPAIDLSMAFDQLNFDLPKVQEEKKVKQDNQITFEDLLAEIQIEPEFVRVNDSKIEESVNTINNNEDKEEVVLKTTTSFDSLSFDSNRKTIVFGLNDRIAFEQNLFEGNSDDFNRVLSQLNTFNSFNEAKDFIINMVKPDYNNWIDKEEYEERFLAVVEQKFL